MHVLKFLFIFSDLYWEWTKVNTVYLIFITPTMKRGKTFSEFCLATFYTYFTFIISVSTNQKRFSGGFMPCIGPKLFSRELWCFNLFIQNSGILYHLTTFLISLILEIFFLCKSHSIRFLFFCLIKKVSMYTISFSNVLWV